MIVTAAHVVDFGQPRRSMGGYWILNPSRFFAIRAKNGDFDLGLEWVTHIAVPAQKPILGSPNDIAILRMQTPASGTFEMLEPVPFNELGPHDLLVAGYPKHWDEAKADGNRIKVGDGPGGINPAVPHELVYKIDTFHGQSGGPVFVRGGTSAFIGIHVNEAQGLHNTGLRFTDENLGWARDVIHRLDQLGS